jgi:hypothetical protein
MWHHHCVHEDWQLIHGTVRMERIRSQMSPIIFMQQIKDRCVKGAFGWASMRDGMGSSLMSEMSSSHLMFGWMDEIISIFCLVGGRGMIIII